MRTLDLTGKTAIVTGGGTGIGRAIALDLARHGAVVVVTGRRPVPLDETVALANAEGLTCRSILTDVTDTASVDGLVADVLGREGKIDILINNAGSFAGVGALWEVDAEDWWRDVTINLKGIMLTIKAVLPNMMARNTGTIINLDGGGGADGANRGGSGYGSSKAAVARLTETLAWELETEGSAVEVYGMFPGLVRSEMTEALIVTPQQRRWQQFVADRFEDGDHRPASDCAKAMVTLLAMAGPDLNGRIFNVDDDLAKIAAERATVARDDLYIMRLRKL